MSLPTAPAAIPRGQRVGCRTVSLEITLFTDPACPFAFSAEPARLRLAWHYGDQLRWRTRMIVLTLEPGEAEKLAEGAPTLQRRYGMPIDPAPYARTASSEPACRAVVAARLNAPEAEGPLLRRLRVRTMLGGLLDEPSLLAAAASDVGLDPSALVAWCTTAEVEQALQADIDAARSPSPARAGARSQARWATAAAALHRPELRDQARCRRSVDHAPRLPSGRGLRGRDRQPRARARAPAQARVRGRRPRLGRPSARHGGGRRHRAARRHAGPRRAQSRRPCDSGRGRLLLVLGMTAATGP